MVLRKESPAILGDSFYGHECCIHVSSVHLLGNKPHNDGVRVQLRHAIYGFTLCSIKLGGREGIQDLLRRASLFQLYRLGKVGIRQPVNACAGGGKLLPVPLDGCGMAMRH